jgi:hypothetical protein
MACVIPVDGLATGAMSTHWLVSVLGAVQLRRKREREEQRLTGLGRSEQLAQIRASPSAISGSASV